MGKRRMTTRHHYKVHSFFKMGMGSKAGNGKKRRPENWDTFLPEN